MALSWVSTDMRTGRIIADLPDLGVDRVSVVLGTYTTTLASLPIVTQWDTSQGWPVLRGAGAPENWERATLEGATVMVLLDDSVSGDPLPEWGGYVTVHDRGSGNTVEMALATLEAALDRFYVTEDVAYEGIGQNAIVADLIDRFVDLPIRVAYTEPGTLRDRTYERAADKTIFSVLTELAGVDGGPEWTIGWEWQHDPERITPVLYVGSRVGASPREGLGPNAWFEMPGSVTEVSLRRDYSAGKGATDVMAVSTASADARPESPRQIVADSDRPAFQHRFTPSTSITNVSTLTAHAAKTLAGMKDGARALSLTAAISAAPRLGADWSIGDDVGYRIGGLIDDPRTEVRDDLWSELWTETFGVTGRVKVNPDGKPSVPAFPRGLEGVARAVGWEMSLAGVQTITPILVLADEGA